MSDLSTIGRMHFIIDGSGNYYRVNAKDQLVVAGSRDEADVFSFIEANKRIGGGKKSHFYSAIPVEDEMPESEEMPENEEMPEHEEMAGAKFVWQENQEEAYDLDKIDWQEYLTHFCYIVSVIKNYQEDLNHRLSEVDMEICDILHYIELYELSDEENLGVIDLLRECRDYRRDIKDEMYRADCFQRAIGTSSNAAKAKESIKLMKKLDSRKYKPRKLTELFEGGIKRERKVERQEEKKRENQREMQLQQKGAVFMKETKEYEIEYAKEGIEESTEEASREYDRKETIYDSQKMDWQQFAQSQLEFYENAGQYIYNLKMDLQDIDASIEDILTQVETANCNVTQGYKIFKWLKELRTARKEKERELACLEALTECFDCEAMVKAYAYGVERVEEIMGNIGCVGEEA